MLFVVAKAKTNAGKDQEFLQVTKELIAETRKEAGCVSYFLYQSTEDITEFTFLEQWESQAALDAHAASPHFVKFQNAAESILAGLDIKQYNA